MPQDSLAEYYPNNKERLQKKDCDFLYFTITNQ